MGTDGVRVRRRVDEHTIRPRHGERTPPSWRHGCARSTPPQLCDGETGVWWAKNGLPGIVPAELDTGENSTVSYPLGGWCDCCGVSEPLVRGELEIDRFHPLAAGGSDDIENLVYACTMCNRFKGDHAPAPDAPDSLRLLRSHHGDLHGL
ncbi:HNH endonuclease [Sorangium sp. So ce124]|uniref:HNH endonuclease n=1 Tax=Sorangium sp. So ce124 TaxID=3133280 RepID=UPI003F607F4A